MMKANVPIAMLVANAFTDFLDNVSGEDDGLMEEGVDDVAWTEVCDAPRESNVVDLEIVA